MGAYDPEANERGRAVHRRLERLPPGIALDQFQRRAKVGRRREARSDRPRHSIGIGPVRRHERPYGDGEGGRGRAYRADIAPGAATVLFDAIAHRRHARADHALTDGRQSADDQDQVAALDLLHRADGDPLDHPASAR